MDLALIASGAVSYSGRRVQHRQRHVPWFYTLYVCVCGVCVFVCVSLCVSLRARVCGCVAVCVAVCMAVALCGCGCGCGCECVEA